jgi:hypothetical protein
VHTVSQNDGYLPYEAVRLTTRRQTQSHPLFTVYSIYACTSWCPRVLVSIPTTTLHTPPSSSSSSARMIRSEAHTPHTPWNFQVNLRSAYLPASLHASLPACFPRTWAKVTRNGSGDEDGNGNGDGDGSGKGDSYLVGQSTNTWTQTDGKGHHDDEERVRHEQRMDTDRREGTS